MKWMEVLVWFFSSVDSIFIHFHPFSSIFIHFHPFPPISTHFHPFPPISTHFHPFQPISIRFLPLSVASTITLLLFLLNIPFKDILFHFIYFSDSFFIFFSNFRLLKAILFANTGEGGREGGREEGRRGVGIGSIDLDWPHPLSHFQEPIRRVTIRRIVAQRAPSWFWLIYWIINESINYLASVCRWRIWN